MHLAANRIYDVIVSVLCVKEEKKNTKAESAATASYKLHIYDEYYAKKNED